MKSLRFTLLLAFVCLCLNGFAQKGPDDFKGIPIVSLSMGYETSKVLNLRAGGGFSHWLDCTGNRRLICGLIRLNHFYEFQYDVLNSTLGASSNTAFVFVWGGLNLQMQYSNDLNGLNNFSLSPQIGADILLGSLYIGPSFNIVNQLGYKKTTFNLNFTLNLYAFGKLFTSEEIFPYRGK